MCNETFLDFYKRRNQIVCHYYGSPDGYVPIWGLRNIDFGSITDYFLLVALMTQRLGSPKRDT
ncbi:MAG: hypothetical protein GX604_04085 [Actinobacteria bacterium]|nr:hypothetical protein [Actinomycetota bacterium]